MSQEASVSRLSSSPTPAMAKSKNHTNNNQIFKAHRNGIKKARRPRQMSQRGMNCRFIRNQAFAKKGMKCDEEKAEERRKMQKEAQKRLEEKKSLEKEKRLKEIEQEKQDAMLKAAGKKR